MDAKLSDSDKGQEDTFDDPNKVRGSQTPPGVDNNRSGEDTNAAIPTAKKVSLIDHGEEDELEDDYALNPPTDHRKPAAKPDDGAP